MADAVPGAPLYVDRGQGTRGDTYHLFRRHADGLDGELAAAHVEEVLQVGPEKVDDEDVVEALLPEVVHLRDARCTNAGRQFQNADGSTPAAQRAHSRVPFNVRYDLYSSRSCGASDFLGSCKHRSGS